MLSILLETISVAGLIWSIAMLTGFGWYCGVYIAPNKDVIDINIVHTPPFTPSPSMERALDAVANMEEEKDTIQ